MGKLPSVKLSPSLRTALPVALIGGGITLFAWVSIQQNFRQSANDQQIQIAEDGAVSLKDNLAPSAIVGDLPVNAATSLAPFVTVFDQNNHVLATSGLFNGKTLAPPAGAFEYAKSHGEDRFTWQPNPSNREAAVLVYSGDSHPGYVLAARSLYEVENRESALNWRAMLTLAGIACVLLIWMVFVK